METEGTAGSPAKIPEESVGTMGLSAGGIGGSWEKCWREAGVRRAEMGRGHLVQADIVLGAHQLNQRPLSLSHQRGFQRERWGVVLQECRRGSWERLRLVLQETGEGRRCCSTGSTTHRR